MGFWLENDLTPKIEYLLKKNETKIKHPHLGRPFMTSMQLAFAFEKEFSGLANLLGYHAGGKGFDDRNSLAIFIAKELISYLSITKDPTIEGAFLSDESVTEIGYINKSAPLQSNVNKTTFDLAMFRLK
jgi:hypothetical protein